MVLAPGGECARLKPSLNPPGDGKRRLAPGTVLPSRYETSACRFVLAGERVGERDAHCPTFAWMSRTMRSKTVGFTAPSSAKAGTLRLV